MLSGLRRQQCALVWRRLRAFLGCGVCSLPSLGILAHFEQRPVWGPESSPACASPAIICQDGQGIWGRGPMRRGSGEMSLFSLLKRPFWGKWDWTAAFWYVRGGCWGDNFQDLDGEAWSKIERLALSGNTRLSVNGTVRHGGAQRGVCRFCSRSFSGFNTTKPWAGFELSVGPALSGSLDWSPLEGTSALRRLGWIELAE